MGKQNFQDILCCIILCSSIWWIAMLAAFFTDFAGTDRFRSDLSVADLRTTQQQEFSLVTKGHTLTKNTNRPSVDTDQTELLWGLQQSGSGDCSGRYVYMYNLPSKFNDLLLTECQNLSVWTNMCPHIANSGLGQPLQWGKQGGLEAGESHDERSWFATNQFTAEVIFHERMKSYQCLTSRPSKATAFYIPFYAGLDMSRHVGDLNFTERDHAGIELAEFLRSKPQWKKRHGRDHFMVMGRIAWDFLRERDSPNAWGNKLLLLPEVRNMSSLVIEAQPWHKNQHGIPYPSYFHPRRRSEIERWQKRMKSKRRQILFSFAGAPRPGLDKASIRGHIFKQCSSSPRCKTLRCRQGPSICHDPAEVLKLFTESVFCLQPQGDSFTRRSIFDSMLAGCIPVLFTEHSAYTQYKWHLPHNRSSYSVYIPEESVQGTANRSIEQHLLSLGADEVEKMRRDVIGLIPSLTYADPRHSNMTSQIPLISPFKASLLKLQRKKTRLNQNNPRPSKSEAAGGARCSEREDMREQCKAQSLSLIILII